MSARVSVTVEDNELLAVKTATSPEEQDSLAHEAARLHQLTHPGVVSLVEHRITPERAELRTLFAGDSLELWRGTVTRAAGLVAAVAAVLADLHDDGFVHGRLDETHVLVGPDGRPRLCGFSPGPDDATAADDVAALGGVFADLLDRATTSDRRGAFRWPRAHVAERRALAGIVAHATDPIPERRPTARALARTILATTPDAELSAASTDSRIAALPPGRLAIRRADLPAVGTAATRTPQTGLVAGGTQPPERAPSSAEGWAVAGLQPEGPRPASVGPGGSTTSPTEDPDAAPASRVGTQPSEVRTVADPGDRGLPEVYEVAVPERVGVDDVFGDQRTAQLDDLFIDRPWPAADHEPDPVRTVRDGARRPQARWRTPITISFLVLAVALVGGYLSVAADPPSDAGAQAPSPASASGRSCAPAPPPAADVDSDGCPEPITVSDGVVHAGGQAWTVGNREDAVVVGDWDCDGLVTPAAYRPSTGDVFVFSGWAGADGPVSGEPVARVGGGRGLAIEPRAAGKSGCDALAVEMANGERQSVEVGR